MGDMKARPIQVVPDPQTSKKIDRLKEQLRTSRAGFAALAVNFVVPLLESGRARVVNGQIEILGEKPLSAA